VLARLEAGPDGLSNAEAAHRAGRYGRNELPETGATSWWRVLARQFVSPLIGILVVTFVITAVQRHWVDAGAIALVLLLNAGIGFWQERKAERSVRALKRLSAPICRVLRDGAEHELPAAELVPGDVVLLESGERVPADLRLLEVNGLQVDESMLTGEVLPVTKRLAAEGMRVLATAMRVLDADEELSSPLPARRSASRWGAPAPPSPARPPTSSSPTTTSSPSSTPSSRGGSPSTPSARRPSSCSPPACRRCWRWRST